MLLLFVASWNDFDYMNKLNWITNTAIGDFFLIIIIEISNIGKLVAKHGGGRVIVWACLIFLEAD